MLTIEETLAPSLVRELELILRWMKSRQYIGKSRQVCIKDKNQLSAGLRNLYFKGNIEKLRSLCELGADPNYTINGVHVICHFLLTKFFKGVPILIVYGANLDVVTLFGTPLTIAC